MALIVNITKKSICFGLDSDQLYLSLFTATKLVKRIKSKFVTFVNAADFLTFGDDFYNRYNTYDQGVIKTLIFDQGLGTNPTSNYVESDLIRLLINDGGIQNEFQNILLNICKPVSDIKLKKYCVKNESQIVEWASNTLKNITYDESYFGDALKMVYKNLVFHDSYNSLAFMSGGSANFRIEIVNFFHTINFIELKPGSVKDDIKEINSKVAYTFCEEGGAKGNRRVGELKRDFIVDSVKYDKVNCEFHYKLEELDAKGTTQHFKNRIYIGFLNASGKKILAIAHIGNHL